MYSNMQMSVIGYVGRRLGAITVCTVESTPLELIIYFFFFFGGKYKIQASLDNLQVDY